jgi:hypothetical protein
MEKKKSHGEYHGRLEDNHIQRQTAHADIFEMDKIVAH